MLVKTKKRMPYINVGYYLKGVEFEVSEEMWDVFRTVGMCDV